MTTRDWIAWHAACDDDTPLRHRLLAVQRPIRDARDDLEVKTRNPPGPNQPRAEGHRSLAKICASSYGAVTSSWS